MELKVKPEFLAWSFRDTVDNEKELTSFIRDNYDFFVQLNVTTIVIYEMLKF